VKRSKSRKRPTVAMIFGKKLVPRGTAIGKGREGRMQRPTTYKWTDEAYVLRGLSRKRKTHPPARVGEMVV